MSALGFSMIASLSSSSFTLLFLVIRSVLPTSHPPPPFSSASTPTVLNRPSQAQNSTTMLQPPFEGTRCTSTEFFLSYPDSVVHKNPFKGVTFSFRISYSVRGCAGFLLPFSISCNNRSHARKPRHLFCLPCPGYRI